MLTDNAQAILDSILEEGGCPFLGDDSDCPADCPCKVFDNSVKSCYDIAVDIKKLGGLNG